MRPLTERQLEYIELVAQGLLDKQIAVRLNVSPPTVKKMLSTARRKLGLRSRVDLAVWWARRS